MDKIGEYDNSYYHRAVDLLEILRAEIGYGYATDDIEHIGEIVVARLRAWEKLDREKIGRTAAKKIAKYLRAIGMQGAARNIENGEYEQLEIKDNILPPYLADKIEQVGRCTYDGVSIPIYREKENAVRNDTDTMALLTKLVNQLKDENELLKRKNFELECKIPFKANYENSSLGKQIGDIEAGKVVER